MLQGKKKMEEVEEEEEGHCIKENTGHSRCVFLSRFQCFKEKRHFYICIIKGIGITKSMILFCIFQVYFVLQTKYTKGEFYGIDSKSPSTQASQGQR